MTKHILLSRCAELYKLIQQLPDTDERKTTRVRPYQVRKPRVESKLLPTPEIMNVSDKVMDFVRSHTGKVLYTSDILSQCLGLSWHSNAHKLAVKQILTANGYVYASVRDGATVTRTWRPAKISGNIT